MAIWPFSVLARSNAKADARPATVQGVVVSRDEEGVSGTVNWSGQLQTENNPDLKAGAGYGRLETWGVFEEMQRTDVAIASALEMVAARIREATIEVEPGGEQDLEKTIADFVKDNLQEWLEPRWSEVATQMVKGGLGTGFSIHEPVHGIRPDKRVPGGEAFYVRKMAQRLPASLTQTPWKEADGELVAIEQQGPVDGRWKTVLLPADRILLLSWQREGNNYAGYSQLRPAYYLWKIRGLLLRLVGVGMSREATGIPTAETTETLDSAQLRKLQTFLENNVFHENAALALPKGVKLNWVHSPGANKGHVIETYEKLGTAIKSLLFSQGNDLGTNGTGSRAVGDVHSDTFEAFARSVARSIEDVINRVGERKYTGLVQRIVDPNWGPQARYPTVRLALKPKALDMGTLSTAVVALSGAGALTLRVEEENELRNRIGFAAITPEEREKAKAEKRAQAMEIAAATPKGDEEEDGAEPSEEREPPKTVKASAGVLPSGWIPKRAPRPSERFLAAAEVDSFLNTARDEFERDGKDLVEDMVRRALPQVKLALADGDPSDIDQVKLDTAGIDTLVRSLIEKARRNGAKQVRAERRRARAEAVLNQRRDGSQKFAPTPLKAAEEEEEDDKSPVDSIDRHEVVDRTEKVVDAQAKLVTKRIANRVEMELASEALDLVNTGGEVETIVERVAEGLLESRTLRTDAGLVLTRSFNLGREEAAAEFAEEVEEVERSALLDGRQCIPCDSRDGETADFGSPEHDALVPPDKECEGGANCRCLLVYRFKEPGFRKVDEE